MTIPDKQSKELDDQSEGESNAFWERVAVLQNKAKALGITEALSESELKAFMDDQWGEGQL